MGVAPSRRKGTKAEWNCEIAFQEYAAGQQPVHRLSFVLLETICGFLTLQGHCCFARVCAAWLGVARSGSARCWAPVRITVASSKDVEHLTRMRCVARDVCVENVAAIKEDTVCLCASSFPALTRLSVPVPQLIWKASATNVWLGELAKLTGLTDLRLTDGRGRKIAGLSRLRSLPLRVLALDYMVLESETVLSTFAQSKMPLTSLGLGSRLSAECSEAVCALPQLQTLRISAPACVPRLLPGSLTSLIVAGPADGLNRLPQLLPATGVTQLSLCFSGRVDWLRELGAAVGSQLRQLVLWGCTLFRRKQLAALCAGLTSLERLRLDSMLLENADLTCLLPLSLRSVELIRCSWLTPAVLGELARISTLQSLEVEFSGMCELHQADLAALKHSAARSLSLQTLRVRCGPSVEVGVSQHQVRELFAATAISATVLKVGRG